MTVFEYVSVLLAIVLGLSVARAMSGIAAFVVADHRSTKDWLVVGWCVGLMYMQAVWWLGGWFAFSGLETFSLGTVMYWITATAMISLASYVLVPRADGTTATATPSKTAVRPAFFACLAGHFGIVLGSAMLSGESIPTSGISGLNLPMVSIVAIPFVLTATGYFLRSDKSLAVHLLIWLLFVSVASALVIPSIGPGSVPIL
jgi:hypothetical protein